MTMLIAHWTSGGVERSWPTQQRPGETLAQLAERHLAEVIAEQVNWPPEPPEEPAF